MYKVGCVKVERTHVMTNYEALKLSGNLLSQLENSGIRPTDHKYIPMYEDFAAARVRGEKVSYTVATLADKYSMSERNVYYVVSRLSRQCKPPSPQTKTYDHAP